MKNILKHFKVLLALLFVVNLTSCSDDDDHTTPPPQTIVEVALDNNLTTFATALEATDLVTTLQGNGPFTVFAPTNESFTDFLTEAGIDINNMTASQTILVKNVLLNHVIAGPALNSDAFMNEGSGYATTQALGPGSANMSLFYKYTEGAIVINGNAMVINGDNTASNGVVHIVDDIIFLPTIVDFVLADENFSSLAASLTADGQPDFATTLSLPTGVTPAPFTVFAPVNSAFQALLDSNEEWNSPSDIDSATLTSVIEHHVITEANVRSSDLTDGMTPVTLEGDMITINLPGNDGNPAKITDGAGNTDIDIITVDVQATNGVIHAIETVLMPDTTN